jgi:hypothetical protein
VKALFLSAAVCAEDQRVPTKIFAVLHAAIIQVGTDTKAASMSTVRKWVRLLINRSLLMELIRGSVQIHDSKSTRLLIEHTHNSNLSVSNCSCARLHDVAI